MHILEDDRFLAWLEKRGIVPDLTAGTGDRLTFAAGDVTEMRWRPKGIVSDLPAFIGAALAGAQAGGPWWLWRRGGGPWMDEFGAEGGIRNTTLDRLLEALGFGGASGALLLGGADLPDVWLIVHAFFVFGWSVGEDLYVVPEDCSAVLLLSHEGRLEARFPSAERAEAFGTAITSHAQADPG